MYFADFYHDSFHQEKALGDRSVYILDGRNNMGTMMMDAISWGRKHSFGSYELRKGETFTRSSLIFKGQVK